MDIALDYYRIFEAVARHRSFTRAAEALVNSQPNLTRAVRNLEAELGCRLFLRSSRGVELTPEGEALYAHVTAAMEQLRAGEAELQRQRELRSGMVSIACSETALHAVLLQVLSRFHRENPAIRLRVSNQSAPEAIDALRSGLAELAVVIEEVGKIIKLAAYKVGSGSRYYNRVKIGGYFTHDIIGNSFYFVVIRL